MRSRLLLLLLGLVLPGSAQREGARVLMVYDGKDAGSTNVAKYYVEKRDIPPQNLCRLKPSDPISLTWESFESQIRTPVRRCLKMATKDQGKILYIVLVYNLPYRLSGMEKGAGQSLDQYLADLWDETTAGCKQPKCDKPQSHTPNPYFAKSNAQAQVYPQFQTLEDNRRRAGSKRIYSVWRLDAATPELAKGLVDKAIAAEQQKAWSAKDRRGCFDRRHDDPIQMTTSPGYAPGEWMIHRAAEAARTAGFETVEDLHQEEFGTAPAPLRCENALFYAGWYSLNHYNDAFSWAPGAVGLHLDSLSALHLRKGGNWVANAVQRGITITSGTVEEPYLDGLPHPDGVLRDLLTGANAGDALLRNTEWLRWQVINVGDPLFRPLSKR